MTVALFIDSQQYLDLYRLASGRKLVDNLEEQAAHIFVSAQIVDEVLRNRLACAQQYFSDRIKELGAITNEVPDQLIGIEQGKADELGAVLRKAAEARKELSQLAIDALPRISRSEDVISQRLDALFKKAVVPNDAELERARQRKELGNPPGKKNDPLGDQITWEQFLTHCRSDKIKRVWIVTRDEDYGIKHEKPEMLLNSRLTKDLAEACGAMPKIHAFSELLAGLLHFGKNAGVKATRLPNATEAAKIEKEIEALPRPGWFGIDDGSMTVVKIHEWQRRNHIAAIAAALSSTETPLAIRVDAAAKPPPES